MRTKAKNMLARAVSLTVQTPRLRLCSHSSQQLSPTPIIPWPSLRARSGSILPRCNPLCTSVSAMLSPSTHHPVLFLALMSMLGRQHLAQDRVVENNSSVCELELHKRHACILCINRCTLFLTVLRIRCVPFLPPAMKCWQRARLSKCECAPVLA